MQGISFKSKLTVMFFMALLFCSPTPVFAETYKDYLQKAQDAYSKDRRDTSTIRSYIQKAASQAANDRSWQGLYESAYWYGKVDSNSDAESCLNKAAGIAESAESIEGLLKISDFYLRILQNREAERCIKAAERIAVKKQDANAMNAISRQYYRVGNNSQAERCIEAAGKMKAGSSYNSGSGSSYGSNTSSSGSSGTQEKYNVYGSAPSTGKQASTEAMILVDQALDFFRMNRVNDAASTLKKAEFTAQRQKDAAGMKYVASAYKKLGFTDRAVECERAALNMEPAGGIKSGANKPETRIMLTNPGWKTELDNAGKLLKENHRGQAFDAMSRAKQNAIDSKSVSGLISTGDYYNYAGGRSEASGCYIKAKELALTAKDSASLRLLADKFRQLGNTGTADQCLKAAQDLEKK
ncbi:MAG: hypothetical protein LWY06_03825 [Firmicutes bacterium]|nr:hypothetical protein [Bacillota bacterium]